MLHFEYLADGSGDPRPGFLEALRAALGTEGSIVSYSSSFEKSRLKEMAARFPEHAAWINEAFARFENADLLAPFRLFAVYDPRQHGSASIKDVLPAFTDMSYADLAIQEGGTASNQFLSLLKGLIPPEQIPTLPPKPPGLLRTGHLRDGETCRKAPGPWPRTNWTPSPSKPPVHQPKISSGWTGVH